MKKVFFVLFFLFFSASLTYAETTIYSNSKDFLIAEGYDCVSASDGCNTYK